MIPVSVHVPGLPVGQPRARAVFRGGHARMYDPGTADAWKAAVSHAVASVLPEPLPGAVDLAVTFYLPRPRSHYGTGRNAGKVRGSAPAYHVSRPDLDNLAKSTMDALLGIAWVDDSQVIRLVASKEWTILQPGAVIRIVGDTVAGGTR